MSKSCRVYRLDEAVQIYCAMPGINSTRNFKNYMVVARLVWGDLLKRTLWNYESDWLQVQGGDTYPYIQLPDNTEYLIGVFDERQDGSVKRLKKLEFDDSVSVVSKPAVKACKCDKDCGCGDNCTIANSFTMEEKEVEIDGDTYTERKWLQVCANGDVLEWREVPTKVYTKGLGSGEFSIEFTPDFNTEDEVFSVDTVQLQRRICQLKTKPCGCIDESEYNKTLLRDKCGVDSTIRNFMFAECCNGTIETKTTLRHSDDPRKIYIIGNLKAQYFVRYQTSDASDISPVPEYALMALFKGIENYSAQFNPTVRDKLTPQYNYDDAKFRIVKYLNPINWKTLEDLQTTRIKY